MVQARQSSKKRKASKTAVPVWAAAGVLAMGGGASANAPATDIPSRTLGGAFFSLSRKCLTSVWALFTFLTEKEKLAPA